MLQRISSRFIFALPFALAAVVVTLGAVRPAQAQIEAQTAVVLDFGVLAGLDPNLGRKAADALAVELQTSTANDPVARQRIEVVPNARVEQVIYDTTALSPPYTDMIQLRLARAVGANMIYSGRVLSAVVNPRKSARVTLEIMQFETAMGDYSNGALISQSAVSPIGDTDNDLLIDEAINKAVYVALTEIKRKPFLIGTVQFVTRSFSLINLGARHGVSRGQKYALLRDVYRGRDATDRDVIERVKIGEMIVTRVDVDQASVVLTSGGGAGVKITDKVRKIYIPTSTPVGLQGDMDRLRNLSADEIEAADAAAAARRLEDTERRREALTRQVEETTRRREAERAKTAKDKDAGF